MKVCKKLLSLFLVVSVLFGGFPVANALDMQKMDFAEEISKAEEENTTLSSEKSRPKVSVIVPVYNTEPYLRECLDSIKNQTLKEIEIICVDDGSPDNCGKILDEYASNDSRFIVVHQVNKGVQEARNAGLDIASGEYITFLDSDDYLQLDAYEVAYNSAKTDDVDIIQFDCRRFQNGKDEHIIENNDYSEGLVMGRNTYIYFGPGPWVWNKLYKSEVIKKDNVKFIKSITPADDTCFAWMVLGRVKRVKVIPTKLYNYRFRKGSLSSGSIETAFINSYKMFKLICDDWRKYGNSSGNEKELLFLIITKWACASWARKRMAMKYAHEVLDSFGHDIYNPETVKKCDEQTQKLIRELEYAAAHPEEFQNLAEKTKSTLSRGTKINRLRRKVVA